MTDEEFERRYKERRDEELARAYTVICISAEARDKERVRGRNRKRKAVISPADKWATWERDDFTCLRCGTRRFLTVDHIIPESDNGATDLRNFQTLCKSCNSSKGTRAVRYVDGEEIQIVERRTIGVEYDD